MSADHDTDYIVPVYVKKKGDLNRKNPKRKKRVKPAKYRKKK